MSGGGINKVILIGRLGRDPEMRYFQDGTPFASFSIATSDSWTDKASGEKKEKTEWHRIVAFRQLAEICGQYLTKGRMVYIEGKLQTREWTDRDGNKRWTTEILANDMQMLGPKSDAASPSPQQGQGYQNRPAGYQGGYGGPAPQGPGGYQGGYGGPAPQGTGPGGGYGGPPPQGLEGWGGGAAPQGPGTYQGGHGGPVPQVGAGQSPASRRSQTDVAYQGEGGAHQGMPEHPEMGGASHVDGPMPTPSPVENNPGPAIPPSVVPDEDDIPF